MPNPSHAITSGSYAGSLNIAGVLQAGLQKLTRHGGTGGSRSCSVSHPASPVASCIVKLWQPGDKLWIKAPRINRATSKAQSQLPLLPFAAVPGRGGGTAGWRSCVMSNDRSAGWLGQTSAPARPGSRNRHVPRPRLPCQPDHGPHQAQPLGDTPLPVPNTVTFAPIGVRL